MDFEAAAQSLMLGTLREVKRLRPKALWGVSPYPACYSDEPSQTALANSSGQCPPAETALNDELLWLWRRCSALYPLLTLEKVQVGHANPRIHLFNIYRFKAFGFRSVEAERGGKGKALPQLDMRGRQRAERR